MFLAFTAPMFTLHNVLKALNQSAFDAQQETCQEILF